MDNLMTLSGEELVARGTTKIDGSLPEIGLKEVIPNGSWLEQKQVQSALESRKHLIEVERIEKCGVLSQAEWREELMLAEVTHKVGGHWHYVGHNVGKQLFLKPEEALFLLEVNCLQLKHCGVTVSLQQAYSLLFRTKYALMQYQVYAALSRVGYKVFRHETRTPTAYEKKINLIPEYLDKHECDNEEIIEVDKVNDNAMEGQEFEIVYCNEKESGQKEAAVKMDIDNNQDKDNNNGHSEEHIVSQQEHVNDTSLKSNGGPMEIVENIGVRENLETSDKESITTQNLPKNEGSIENDSEIGENGIMVIETVNETSNEFSVNKCSNANDLSNDCSEQVDERSPEYHKSKLQLLEDRKLKPHDSKGVQKSFQNIPNLLQHVVTVKIPEEQFIPKNVFLNKTTYVLNLESIKRTTKDAKAKSSNSRSYSMPQEENGAHVRRVRGISASNSPHNSNRNWIPPFHLAPRFQRPNFQFRPFWRPDFSSLNMIFNSPVLGGPMSFPPRPNFFPRPPPPPFFGQLLNYMNDADVTRSRYPWNSRKRIIDTKKTHLEAIKRLAYRLSQLVESANTDSENVQSLQRLIDTYNVRYKSRIRLSDQFQIEEQDIVETIELDCEDVSARKKPRTEPDKNKYEENLNRLKQLSLKLKDLEGKDKANGRHRRAFSNVIKRFNKSYNADVYLSSNYEVTDRFLVNLDSSSDSDCVIEENPSPSTSSGKKLRNPFNILKRLSEKHPNNPQPTATTSKEGMTDEDIVTEDKSYSEFLVKTFNKTWLPDEHNFGRAEVVSRKFMHNYLMDPKREEYLYEFLKAHPHSFKNWLGIKISFLRSVTLTTNEYTNGNIEEENGLKSLIEPKDCTNMRSVLKKLSIIQANMEDANESSLSIDYDVYNRDVQNFRKTNRPKPHFRVICIHESASFPLGSHIFALHSKYKDNVAILFAVVGIASVSYVQVNPAKLPLYMPSKEDLT